MVFNTQNLATITVSAQHLNVFKKKLHKIGITPNNAPDVVSSSVSKNGRLQHYRERLTTNKLS
jgi:hypothetical protein